MDKGLLLGRAASMWRANTLAMLGAAVCVAALAAAWTLAFIGIASDRAGALAEIERNNGNLVRALEEQTRRALRSVDQTVLFARRDFLQRGRDLDLADLVAAGDIEVRNRKYGDPSSAILQIRVLDAGGDPLLFAHPVKKVNVADRTYFAVHKDLARGDRAYVSSLVVSRATGIASIQVSRRILDSRGGFNGVVTASVDVAYFTALYEGASYGPRDIISLVSLEGETIARRVGPATSFGQDLRGSELLARQKEAADGSYTGPGHLDDITRHYSYRTLPDLGLLVSVGSAIDDALAPAAARRRIYLVSTGIASALLLVVLALLAGAARRQNRFVAELTKRELRFRRLFENSHDAIVAVDVASDGSLHVTDTNPAATELGGIDAEGVIGSAHAEDSSANEASLAASVRQCAASGERVRFEGGVRSSRGELFLAATIAPLRRVEAEESTGSAGETGAGVGVVVMAQDITERRRAERELAALSERTERRERMLQTMLSSIPDFAYIFDREGRFLFANQPLLDLWGITLEQAVGKNSFDLGYPAELAERLQRQVQQVFDSGRNVSDETPYVSLIGVKGCYEYIFSPAFAADGSVEFVAGSTRDVTARKQGEMALRASEAEFRTLAEAMPQIVWVTRADGWNIYFSQQWMDYTGLTLEESLGHGWNKPFHPDDKQRAWDAWQQATATNGIYSIESRLRRADGVYRWWLVRGVPQVDPDGNILKWFGTCTDIHELKELNTDLELRVHERTLELNLARDEAERANQAKSAFLATMSHEIRTPMNGVIGMIEVLQQTSLKGHQVEMVDLIRDSAFSLLHIIEDILDFSRIEAGKLTVENEPMQLTKAVEQVCSMLDHLALARGVRLTMFIDPALPPIVVGDEGRLRQVLINLAGNAIKFSGGRDEPGHVSVRVVQVARESASATLDVIVADDGIGIDAATLARLFTPFSQADASTTRRFGGSGLGLAISSMLVHLMGGAVTVQSAPGIGSTFVVRLTLATPTDAAAEVATEVWASGLHCRVVGGSSVLAQDLAAYLVHAGIGVTRSPDLATASAAEPPSGLSLWLILPGAPVPALPQLRALAPGRAEAGTHFVLAGWGKRRHARVEAADLVTIDVDSLPRQTLLAALALATGRTSPALASGAPEPRRAEPAPPRLQARLQGRLILVAEDNQTNRAVISRQLALIGFAADLAVDGSEALALWRTGDFALLLTDLQMPQMDGYALTAAIRREEGAGRRTPIVALTANALRGEEQRCRAVGMDGYLVKPVRLAQLKTTIEAWLGPAPTAAPPVPVCADQTSTDHLAPADLDVLKALVGDDPEVIDEVLQAFRKGAALADVALSEGIAAGGGKAVADTAHKLKSAAHSIGARRLGDLCDQIENVAEARNAVELNMLLASFQAESAAVLGFLDSR